MINREIKWELANSSLHGTFLADSSVGYDNYIIINLNADSRYDVCFPKQIKVAASITHELPKRLSLQVSLVIIYVNHYKTLVFPSVIYSTNSVIGSTTARRKLSTYTHLFQGDG